MREFLRVPHRSGMQRTGLLVCLGSCLLAFEASAAERADACMSPCFLLAQAAPADTPVEPAAVDPKTIETYGMALALGPRAKQFPGEIAAIRDAVQQGDAASIRAAVRALYAKMGRPVPEGVALDRLVSQLPAAEPGAAGANTFQPLDQPPQGSSSGPATPLGGSKANSTASAPPDAKPTVSGSSVKDDPTCGPGQPQEAFSPAKLAGEWSDAAGERRIRIRPKNAPPDNVNFTLRDRYLWQGKLEGQKLTFTRKPTAAEINPQVPEWARKTLEGTLEWSLELDARFDCAEATLEGKWYPGELKIREESDASGKTTRQIASIEGKGRGIDLKFTRAGPAIAQAIVLENQTAIADGGVVALPYPFGKRAGTGTQTENVRTLFIYGRGLPKRWSDPIEFKSADPTLKYAALALAPDPDEDPAGRQLNVRDREQLARGWQIATLNLDDATRKFVKDMDALIVRVLLEPGVLPGKKEFTLNGLNADWLLTFGDTMAAASFMREITEDVADPTTELILPEQVFLQVQTAGPLPIDTLQLVVHVNGAHVFWNGEETIRARRISDTVYRTDRIELFEAGKPPPPAAPGLFALPARVGDQVYVEIDDPYLLSMIPAVLRTPVIRTPAELGETWKEALTRAARDTGVPPSSDWYRLSAAQAAEITSFNWTSLTLGALDSVTPMRYLATAPGIGWFLHKVFRTNRPQDFVFDPLTKGKFAESMPVTVGDLAALYLFADEFVRSTKTRLEGLRRIRTDAQLRTLRASLRPNALDRESEWTHIRVTCPSGGAADGCPYPYALYESYLKKTFGDRADEAEKWSLAATREAVAKLIEAGEASVKKVEGLTAAKSENERAWELLKETVVGDPRTYKQRVKAERAEKLLEILGYTYGPLLPAVNRRMMRLDEVGSPPRQLWVPDRNGRYELRNLHLLHDAVIAQKNYAELDKTFFLSAVGAIASPVLTFETLAMESVAWLADGAMFAIPLALDIRDAARQRDDLTIALGVSLVLGTQLLDERELAKTEWFEVALNNIPNAFQASIGTYRMVGTVRAHLAMAAIEKGGQKALVAMSSANQDAFWRFVTEASLLRETRRARALSVEHRRALIASRKVLREMNIATTPTMRLPARVEATGQPAVASEAPTVKKSKPVLSDQSITVTRRRVAAEPPEAAGAVPQKPAPGATPASEAPTHKNAGEAPKGGATEPGKAGNARPREFELVVDDPLLSQNLERKTKPKPGEPPEPIKFIGVYDGKQRTFELGEELGRGSYARVFELPWASNKIPGCEKGCVMKIFEPYQGDEFFELGANQVRGQEYSSKLLARHPDFPDVSHPATIGFYPDSPMPFLIQEKLADPVIIYQTRSAFVKARVANPKLGPAVMELVRRLKLRGLVLDDFKINNLYFVQVGPDEWVAGILDFDRIVPWAAREAAPNNLGAWMGYMEAHGFATDYMREGKVVKNGNASMKNATVRRLPGESGEDVLRFFQKNPGPYYRDIDLTWEKTLEYQEWLRFDEVTNTYVDGLLKVEDVKPVLPRINDPERLSPFDASQPFSKPAKVGWAPRIPLRARGLPAFPVDTGAQWRLAA